MTEIRALWRRLRALSVSGERRYVMDNLNMLLVSGMDIISAFEAVIAGIQSKHMKHIIREVITDIQAGKSLASALESSYLFSSQFISLVRIGEESGRLPESIQMIVFQQQKEEYLNSKVRSAMFYPVTVLVIAIIIALGMAWFVLPRLVSVFAQLDVELPLVTQLLFYIAEFLQSYGVIVIPAIVVGLTIGTYFIFFFSKTRWIGQNILFRMPGIGRLIMQIEIARMGYMLGTLLEAGLPIIRSFDSLKQATIFRAYARLFDRIQAQIKNGLSWQEAFSADKKSEKLIPAPIQQMIIAGDTSGQLPQTFLKIGDIFEHKTDTTTKNLTVMLEPILMIIVWLIVASIALAVIMPIYGLIGGLQTGSGGGAQSSSPASTPQAVVSSTPTPSVTPTPVQQIRILDTPTGTLNVRSGPGLNESQITQVLPGEVYEFIGSSQEESVWHEIILSGDESGWVFGEYTEFVKETQSGDDE